MCLFVSTLFRTLRLAVFSCGVTNRMVNKRSTTTAKACISFRFFFFLSFFSHTVSSSTCFLVRLSFAYLNDYSSPPVVQSSSFFSPFIYLYIFFFFNGVFALRVCVPVRSILRAFITNANHMEISQSVGAEKKNNLVVFFVSLLFFLNY